MTGRFACGLRNLGNTCFLNSVFQLLVHLAPFLDFLSAHLNVCKPQRVRQSTSPRICYVCALATMADDMFTTTARTGGWGGGGGGAAVSTAFLEPVYFVNRLPAINRRFRVGRQEDSQEFLVGVLDVLDRLCRRRPELMDGLPALPDCGLFRGRLLNRTHCPECGHNSDVVDPFETLSLEITGCANVDEAVAAFTRAETLDAKNLFACEHCKKKVRAEKSIRVAAFPRVLVVHLKRFTFRGNFAFKVQDHVAFGHTLTLGLGEARLNAAQREAARAHGVLAAPGLAAGAGTKAAAAPALASARGEPRPPVLALRYDLVGVNVHSGWSATSGHYYSFVRPVGSGAAPVAPGGSVLWRELNDSFGYNRPWDVVRAQQAYMLVLMARDPAALDAINAAAPLPRKPVAPAAAAGAAAGAAGGTPSAGSKRPAETSSSSTSPTTPTLSAPRRRDDSSPVAAAGPAAKQARHEPARAGTPVPTAPSPLPPMAATTPGPAGTWMTVDEGGDGGEGEGEGEGGRGAAGMGSARSVVPSASVGAPSAPHGASATSSAVPAPALAAKPPRRGDERWVGNFGHSAPQLDAAMDGPGTATAAASAEARATALGPSASAGPADSAALVVTAAAAAAAAAVDVNVPSPALFSPGPAISPTTAAELRYASGVGRIMDLLTRSAAAPPVPGASPPAPARTSPARPSAISASDREELVGTVPVRPVVASNPLQLDYDSD
jgi:ubiquitin C-terminal hydrolase